MLEVRRQRLEQRAPGVQRAAGRPRRPAGGGRGRRRRAPARAAGRRCATGRGRLRPARGAPRCPDSAARAETCAWPRSSATGPTTTGPSPKWSATAAAAARRRRSTPPSTTTSRSPWTAHSASMPGGPRAHRRTSSKMSVSRAVGRRRCRARRRRRRAPPSRARWPARAPSRRPRRGAPRRRPAPRAGRPRRRAPRRPGRRPRRWRRRPRGRSAAPRRHRRPRRSGSTQLVDVVLDHLDRQPDQVDGLLQADHAGQRARRGAEDRRRRARCRRAPAGRRRGGTSRRSRGCRPGRSGRPRTGPRRCRSRNHGMSCSIRAIAAVLRAPVARWSGVGGPPVAGRGR